MEEWELPAPPADYPYAAPDYLYAPRREDDPTPPPDPAAPDPGQTGTGEPTSPPMVWSAAASTWVPAPQPTDAGSPPVPPEPTVWHPPTGAGPRPHTLPIRGTVAPRFSDRRTPEQVPWILLLAIFVLTVMVAGIFYLGYQHSARRGGVAQAPPATPPAAATTGPRLGDLLSAQAAAMQRGDEVGFLAVVDPLATSTVARYKRIFTNLRAMHVSQFGQGSPDGGAVVDLPDHHAVGVSFCVGDIDYCSPRTVSFDVTVERRGTTALIESVDFVDGLDSPTPPLPWEVSDLTVKVEPGLLVAASPATATRLPAMLPMIRQAAAVARKYAVLSMVPDQYTIYVGDGTDQKTWFGGHLTGATQTVSDFEDFYPAIMVVLPDAAATGPLGGDGLAASLRGALARATLFDDMISDPHGDTLEAGMIAYASYHGSPTAAKDALAAAASLVRSGRWVGECFADDASKPVDPAAPGLGYLAIRYLVSEYGFDKTLDFWGDVERSGNSLNTSSISEFGPSWATVDRACATYIRGVAKG